MINLDLNELLQIVYFDIELLRGLLEEVLRAGKEVPVHFQVEVESLLQDWR